MQYLEGGDSEMKSCGKELVPIQPQEGSKQYMIYCCFMQRAIMHTLIQLKHLTLRIMLIQDIPKTKKVG
ncbi:MAG: hypothetical protein AVO35_04670 [Candidatus Aegiribacteria sp. MLS_C]|nr:MAG: hypothetical protein AVO35_04670 [Candidatus Aegiribacteria sp. MLS_C]